MFVSPVLTIIIMAIMKGAPLAESQKIFLLELMLEKPVLRDMEIKDMFCTLKMITHLSAGLAKLFSATATLKK
ncbi:hypothetical protein E2C01_067013 [Portunus trituberculatus]|uniref:Uncharacterized protein n=1 Tax=Portunus trituberculatus TaxID=210409 RepID=A0A5B7HIP7_PORTR|nr:hypothetical protein [Portunus trituberculatus]